ncbi:MAG: putative toxin-antitoxin system toxin component, PIN family [Xanthomonadaceae bacterium]|nr:putative toxin-antitoxin system toxin component, PIN family [Xanthomonadaceae bacterium]
MIRAVIDTNIVVSGLLFGGVPLKLLKAAIGGHFIYVTSPVLIEEAERVLSSNKFGLLKQEIKSLTAPLFEVAEIVIPTETLHVIDRCPADNRVLECAVEGDCQMIVSGDRRDLLSLKQYEDVRIVTARQFLDQLR